MGGVACLSSFCLRPAAFTMGGVAGQPSRPKPKQGPNPAPGARGGKHGMPCLQEMDTKLTRCVVLGAEMRSSMIGSTSKFITKRMAWDGSVSNTPSENNFISVGNSDQVAIKALQDVYGAGLCPAALCSTKPDEWRCQCCDQKHLAEHKRLDTKAHRLPKKSGPNHKRSWTKVLDLTEEIRRSMKKRKRK